MSAAELARLYDQQAPALFRFLMTLTHHEADTRDLLPGGEWPADFERAWVQPSNEHPAGPASTTPNKSCGYDARATT